MRVCEHCGTEFEPKTARSRYCSQPCSARAASARQWARVKADPRALAAHNEQKRADRAKVKRSILADRPCLECGEMFTPKTVRSTVCSVECRAQHRSRVRAERRAPLAQRPGETAEQRRPKVHTCRSCGIDFELRPGSSGNRQRCYECQRPGETAEQRRARELHAETYGVFVAGPVVFDVSEAGTSVGRCTAPDCKWRAFDFLGGSVVHQAMGHARMHGHVGRVVPLPETVEVAA